MDSTERRLIGQRLGTCILNDLIGSGGMGMVFLANQTRPTRQVAVKVLKSGVGMQSEEHQEFLARFRREANVIAQLDHINILQVYEYGEEDGVAYLVMPYLTGGNLRTLLSEKKQFTPLEAFSYFEQAASALQYAHNHKIVHRDIKPANMLFHADGRLVLADFGIARIIGDSTEARDDSITATGYFVGSVDYMAPEMATGMKVDHRADIYELGVVLFQLLTGQLPFQGSTPFIIAAMHINNAPPSMRQIRPSIPAALDAVVLRALAKEADERYHSVDEFLGAFRRALSSSISLAPGTGYSSGLSPFPGVSDYAPVPLLTPDEQKYATVETDTPQQLKSAGLQPPQQPSSPDYGRESANNAYMQQYMGTDGRTPRAMPYSPGTSANLNMPQKLMPDDTGFISQWSPQQVPPQYPVPPQERARRSRGLIGGVVIACIVLMMIVVGGAIFWPQLYLLVGSTPVASQTATPPPVTQPAVTPTPTSADQARAALIQYYDYVNARNYQPAYNMWSVNSEYRTTHTYQQYANGFADTAHVNVKDGVITANRDGSYHIPVTLSATDMSGNTSTFTGYYDLQLINSSWQIVNAQINVAS
jgi:serine/threonine-protein kinase